MASVTLTGKGTIASSGRAALRLSIPFAGHGAIASGGTINTGLVSALTAKAITIADRLAGSSPTTLTDSIQREWREELSEAGFGSLVLMNDNALVASLDWLPNLLVDFHIGATLAYTILVEQYEAVDIDERDEEVGELTQYKGRGHVSLLDRILIYPALGPYQRPIEEDRAFNFADPAYDDTVPPWVAASAVTTVFFAKSGWAGGGASIQWDADYPDDTAEVLWASDGTLTSAQAGTCYGRRQFTVANTQTHTLYSLCDNYGEIYVDGVLMLSPGQDDFNTIGFTSLSKIVLDLTAGTHTLAWKCTNESSPSGTNPAGLAWSLYESDATGALGTLIANSSTSDKIVEYADEPPGMTPGQAIIICLDEALEREADPLWQAVRDNLNFDEARDSNGDYWPTVADMATKVGTTLFTFLRELSATYIDFSMSPGGFILNAWSIGGRSSGGTASFYAPTSATDESTGNLLRLKRTGAA